MEIINFGVAWGWWPSSIWLSVGAVILALVIWWFGISWETMLIAIGGSSNLVSRWQKGGVVDYWRLPGGLWFNLADVLIMIGVIGLLGKNLWHRK